MISNFAPIALFAYNRPIHLTQCLQSLRENKEAVDSELFIFSDGARDFSAEEQVQNVRKLIQNVEGFKSVTVIRRDKNLGLAKSIITGVTELIEKFGKVIVLEDDLVFSPYFLKYMNQGLDTYADQPKVASIHGYVCPMNKKLPETFFLKGADCQGWATWSRSWDQFEQDGKKLLQALKNRKLEHRFDWDGTQANIRMLKNQITGKNSSWAIRWHASAFLKDQMTLFPGKSLVNNIGFDNSGTHCGVFDSFKTDVSQEPITVTRIPIQESHLAREALKSFYRSITPTLGFRIKQKLKNILLGQA